MKPAKKPGLIMFFLALGVYFLSFQAPSAMALTKIKFAFGTPTIQVLMLNIAIGNYLGYYQEEGIDFEIVPAGTNTATLQGLATGQFQMGVFVPATVLPLAAKGAAPPLIAYYNYTPKFKYDFVMKPGTDIKSVAQLKGKTIGVPALGHSATLIARAILRQAGMNPDTDVKIVVAGYGPAAGDMITRGKVDAYCAGDTDFGRVEAIGFALEHMNYKVEGDLKGIGGFYLGATEKTVTETPKFCVGVGRAVAKGTVFALANLPAAAEIFLEMYPGAAAKGKSREEAIKDIVNIIGARSKNWVRDDVSPHKWGIMLDQDFKNELKFSDLEGKIPDVTKYYTNRFIDEINTFDAAKIREAAATFKLKK